MAVVPPYTFFGESAIIRDYLAVPRQMALCDIRTHTETGCVYVRTSEPAQQVLQRFIFAGGDRGVVEQSLEREREMFYMIFGNDLWECSVKMRVPVVRYVLLPSAPLPYRRSVLFVEYNVDI